jgi:hypothetical protein
MRENSRPPTRRPTLSTPCTRWGTSSSTRKDGSRFHVSCFRPEQLG